MLMIPSEKGLLSWVEWLLEASSLFPTYHLIYYLKIEYNNDLPNNIAVDSIDSSQLLYSGDVKAEGNLVSKKIFNPILTKKLQYVQYNNPTPNKALKSWGKDISNNNTSSSSMQKDVINIQLPYDPNQPMICRIVIFIQYLFITY